MHSAGWYLDFRTSFPHLFEHEIQIRFPIRISLEKKLGARRISWVLKDSQLSQDTPQLSQPGTTTTCVGASGSVFSSTASTPEEVRLLLRTQLTTALNLCSKR